MAAELPWLKLLGGKIRNRRMASGLTQREAAAHYGCSLRWWQELEHGKNISIKTLILIGRVLVVKPWLLLRW